MDRAESLAILAACAKYPILCFAWIAYRRGVRIDTRTDRVIGLLS